MPPSLLGEDDHMLPAPEDLVVASVWTLNAKALPASRGAVLHAAGEEVGEKVEGEKGPHDRGSATGREAFRKPWSKVLLP